MTLESAFRRFEQVRPSIGKRKGRCLAMMTITPHRLGWQENTKIQLKRRLKCSFNETCIKTAISEYKVILEGSRWV